MRAKLAFVALFMGTLACSSVAHAQTTAASGAYPACTKQPSKSEMEAAHGAYLAARSSFDEGDYATAITYFKDAYRRDCTKHELLPIIARAYELSQNRPEAILALETFLKRVPPNDPQIDAIKKRIQNLRSLENKGGSPAATPATAPAAPPDSSASAPPSSPAASPAPASGASSNTSTTEPSTDRKTNIGPYLVMGAGAIGAIVGGVVLAGGLSKRTDAVERCPTSANGARVCDPGVATETQKQFDDGTSQATVGGIVLGVSGAVLVGGVVWLIVDKTSSRSSAAAALPLTVSVGREAASASYRIAF